MLTLERIQACLEYDPCTGVFTWKPRPLSEFSSPRMGKIWNTRYAGQKAGNRHCRGYWEIAIDDQKYLAHRLAWFYTHGKWPEPTVDHINRDKSDNRIENLREATHAEQNRNMGVSCRNKTGVSGVGWHKASQKWRARLGTEYIGIFDTIEEAISARRKAEALNGYA